MCYALPAGGRRHVAGFPDISCINTAGGNWNNTAIWSNCGGLFLSEQWRTSTYDATVATGTVTLNTTATLSQLTVNSGTTLNLGTNQMEVLGAYSLQGTVTAGTNSGSGSSVSGTGTYLTGGVVDNVANNANIAFVGTSGTIMGTAGGIGDLQRRRRRCRGFAGPQYAPDDRRARSRVPDSSIPSISTPTNRQAWRI